jgi:hypothetical protein
MQARAGTLVLPYREDLPTAEKPLEVRFGNARFRVDQATPLPRGHPAFP